MNGKETILTWNIQHGGGKRIDAIADYITQHPHAPTTVVLAEFRNNAYGHKMQNRLYTSGFEHQCTAEAAPNTNLVLIASKHTFTHKTFDELDHNKHRIIEATFDAFKLLGCYFPNQEKKYPVFDFVVEYLKHSMHTELPTTSPSSLPIAPTSAPTSAPTILTGDFNTGKHYLDEEKATLKCAEYFDMFEKSGVFDVWRTRNPERREYTWFPPRGKTGFRLDHFFATGKIVNNVSECFYDHDVRLNKLSDHSAMLLQFNLTNDL